MHRVRALLSPAFTPGGAWLIWGVGVAAYVPGRNQPDVAMGAAWE